MPARRSLLALCCPVLLLAGCGNDRTPAPDVATPGPRLGVTPGRDDEAGIRFAVPAGWTLTPGAAPLVAAIAAGRATVSIFRYPRSEPLPRTRAELDAAAEALAGAARQRDPSFTEVERRRRRVDGRPAVVLRGTQTVAGQPRTVRSTHVYAFGGEVVVDAIAPARDFARVDAEVFRPLTRSLRVARPAG